MKTRGRVTWAAALTLAGAVGTAILAGVIFGATVYQVGTILLVIGIIPTTLFLVRYLRVRWWRTPEGRHLVGMGAVIDLVLVEELLYRFIPGDRGVPHDLFIAVALLALVFLMWQRYLMLVVAQREVRREREQWQQRAKEVVQPKTPWDDRRHQ